MSKKQPWFAPTREEILECLRNAGVPLTPAELAKALAVPDAHIESMGKRLAAMERDGQLLPNRKGVLLLASKLDLVAGKVQGHRDGFGFLLPDAGGPDLFLSPREMQKAMHGDRVLVKQTGYDARGRPEGRIVEVTERANRVVVGRFLNERGVHIVVPEDQRIKHDIVIPPGDTQRAQHGQVVTAEIVDPPANGAPPIGRVVEVLGEIGDPGMEIEIAVRKFDVPHQFSDATLAQAEALPGVVRAADLRRRVDLRDIPLVTIDGEDARDFDDAVWCEPVDLPPDLSEEPVGVGATPADAPGGPGEQGASSVSTEPDTAQAAPGSAGRGWRLLVAIADVSHYVKPGEPLDQDALERSTSVYFPRRVIPMLPEKLSNGLCSLNPRVDRLVLVCDMIIDALGQVRAYQFYDAVMNSAARLTYDAVWTLLSGGPAAAALDAAAAVSQPLHDLHDLYRAFAGARGLRGAMELETVETKIICDPAGRIERIVPQVRNDAHRLIEECMLAANVCAADFMQRNEHPGLFRIHEGPTHEKLARLREFLRTAGLSLGGGEKPTPRDYAMLAAQMQSRPEHLLMQAMLLRSMQQAVYSPDNVGHFGLAYDAYAHFTSPIRRYPDLLTHRVIKALLRQTHYRPRTGGSDEGARSGKADVHATWQALGVQCSTNERRADDASRDVAAWLKCMYMLERVGEQYSGRITGVAPFGVFVTLDELYVEGMVHVSELGSEYFQYIEAGHELRGERTGRRFRLTDPIDVQLLRVDLEARRMEFRLVERTDFRSIQRDRQRAARDGASAPAENGKRMKPANGVPERTERLADDGHKAGARIERQKGKRDTPAALLLPLPDEPSGRSKPSGGKKAVTGKKAAIGKKTRQGGASTKGRSAAAAPASPGATSTAGASASGRGRGARSRSRK